MTILYLFAIVGAFIIYLLIDLLAISGNLNAFTDKWLKKTLWIWLPFYALWKLGREMIWKKK